MPLMIGVYEGDDRTERNECRAIRRYLQIELHNRENQHHDQNHHAAGSYTTAIERPLPRHFP
mgnify:CR=1 FL=1